MTDEKYNALHIQALKIVDVLIGIEQPKSSADVPEWLKKVKLFQSYLSSLWGSDPSGKLMVACLTYLYEVITVKSTSVGPAAWSILDLVEEKKISEFVEGILSLPSGNDNPKVKNVITAMIKGLCQCGPYTPRLHNWILALVRGLEAKKNYTVLVEVSENEIWKLLQSLMIPLYRPLIYPIFRRLLFPVATPHVFYKILDEVPGALNILHQDLEYDENKSLCLDFAGLIKALLLRFPLKPEHETKYNLIRAALLKFPETSFNPSSMRLWDSRESFKSIDRVSQDLNNVQDNVVPPMPYKGLMNQGNTCFMNSVLQILYMTTRFRKALLEKEIDPSERAACDLQQLFAFMQESNRTVLVPNRVMDSTLPPTFRRGHQQDSSEYLIYLLDILDETETKVIKRKRQNFNNDKRREGNGDFEEGETSIKTIVEENTVVERLFGGATVSTTVCSFCKKSFPKNERFRNLHLPIPDDYKTYDLQELINLSLEPEELSNENMYDCESCGMKRDATRNHAIVKAPEHLILTLKLFRFDSVKKQRLKLHSRLKNVKSVELPVYNSIQFQTQLIMYDLKGMVLHSGSSLDGGHYFSCAVDQAGQWYTFNDSIVSSTNFDWKWNGSGTPYVLVLRQSNICDPPESPLPSYLQILVNKDNQKFLTEKRFQQRAYQRKKDYDDDWDDAPPNSGSLGGPGPSLVF